MPKHFLLHTRGAALLEFALILPLLALLFIGVTESTRILLIKRKLEAATYSLGQAGISMEDMAAAERQPLLWNTILPVLMTPHPFSGVAGRVTQLAKTASGLETQWSSASNSDVPPANSGSLESWALYDGQKVVLVELSLSYSSLFSVPLWDGKILTSSMVHYVRN
jgi:Flp pilus assembly protein TadG